MKLYTQEQVNDLMVLLQQSFLPENIECDGAHCMGCWKDVVRETLKKMANLTPIELPSDEEIEKESNEWWSPKSWKSGANWVIEQISSANWVIEQIKQQDNDI
jgi:hypothetical protein